MKAKALVCDEKQNLTLSEVTLADPSPDQIAMRTLYSGVSVGTELALVRNKLSWGPYPICTGYQSVGVVEQVGNNVKDVQVGQKVYVRGNTGMALGDGTAVSCVAGTHCSMLVTEPGGTHGAAVLGEGVDDAAASMFVMPAVGLFGVDMAGPQLGDTVVVCGAGPIGLGVVAAAAHRGCVVIAADLEPKRLEIARQLGADYLINAKTQNVADEVHKIAPEGADVVFEATGIPKLIDPAIELCRERGKFVYQGNYGSAPYETRFLVPHERKVTAYYPCDDGLQPCRRAVLKNMASGALPWETTITHRIEAAESPAFFEKINNNDVSDVICAVIHWS